MSIPNPPETRVTTKVVFLPFDTPQDMASFIAEAPEDLRDMMNAIYAAGIVHATNGLVVAIAEPIPNLGDTVNVH